MKKHFSLFVFPLLLMIISCGPDGIIEPLPGDAVLSATIDGEDFLVTGVVISANFSDINGGLHTLSIGGAKPLANGTTEGIALALISADSTEIKAGETYTAVSLSKRGSGEYFSGSGSSRISASSLETDVATLTITEIDSTKKTVSGSFSFDGIDKDDPGKVYEVRDGKFQDVPYK